MKPKAIRPLIEISHQQYLRQNNCLMKQDVTDSLYFYLNRFVGTTDMLAFQFSGKVRGGYLLQKQIGLNTKHLFCINKSDCASFIKNYTKDEPDFSAPASSGFERTSLSVLALM